MSIIFLTIIDINYSYFYIGRFGVDVAESNPVAKTLIKVFGLNEVMIGAFVLTLIGVLVLGKFQSKLKRLISIAIIGILIVKILIVATHIFISSQIKQIY